MLSGKLPSVQQPQPDNVHDSPYQCMSLDARADWSTFHFSAFAVNTYDTPMSLLHCPAGRSNIGILRLIDATLTELCEPFGCRRMQVRAMET
jgi:hypothetical protein